MMFFKKPDYSEDIVKARRNFCALIDCDAPRAIREYENELRQAKIIGRITEPQYQLALIQLNQYLTEKGYDNI